VERSNLRSETIVIKVRLEKGKGETEISTEEKNADYN